MPESERGSGGTSPRTAHVAALVSTSLLVFVLLLPGDSGGTLSARLSLDLPDQADKWVHGLLFFIETRFLVRSFRLLRRGLPPLATAICTAVVLGALTEIAQLWVPHRSGDFADWIADLAGAVAYGVWYHGPWRTGKRSSS